MTNTTQTLGQGYTVAPQEVIDLIGKDARITREICYSHPVCNSGGNTLHYGALIWPARYAVTLEQKQHAENEYKSMKEEKVKSIGNKLVFVGMGMEYAARYEDDVCNHRIRTEIVNPDGKRFFIEVGTGRGETMRIDHVVDRDQEHHYNERAAELRAKIKDSGMLFQRHPLFDEYQKYMNQPYYWYRKEMWNSLNVKYTLANVLRLVNKVFDCNFTEIEVEYNLLSCDDYVSQSPIAADAERRAGA